jgi:hypothetical protein
MCQRQRNGKRRPEALPVFSCLQGRRGQAVAIPPSLPSMENCPKAFEYSSLHHLLSVVLNNFWFTRISKKRRVPLDVTETDMSEDSVVAYGRGVQVLIPWWRMGCGALHLYLDVEGNGPPVHLVFVSRASVVLVASASAVNWALPVTILHNACLSVGATALVEPWPPPQPVSTVRFLNKIIFYRMGMLAPCPTPILED